MTVCPRNSRLALISVLAMVLAASVGACASLRETAAPAIQAPALISTPSGTVVLQPEPGLFASGQPAAEDWRAVADSGIRTVINLRPPGEMKERDERAEVDATGMRYIELPIEGAAGITPDNAARLLAILRDTKGPVLVHCASGNRVGALLALARAQEGASVETALSFGRSAGMKSAESRVREVLGAPAATCAVDAGAGGSGTECAAGR